MKSITILKIGGAVSGHLLPEMWKQVAILRQDRDVIVVHGGGPQSTAIARKMGHEPKMINGRRITSEIDLEISKMAISGQFNTNLTASAIVEGLPAIGISGIANRLVSVSRRPPWQINGESVDFGLVGDIDKIDTDILGQLLESCLLPIVASMGIDETGSVYNVNADTVAAAIAIACASDELILVTDAGGVFGSRGEHKNSLSAHEARHGIRDGWIAGGMIVKVNTALDALASGVRSVSIKAADQIGDPQTGTLIQEEIYA